MHKITADWIYPVTSPPLQNHVITYNERGEVILINSIDQHDKSSVRKLNGVIIPGFINAHCHLELSHMKGMVDTGTGLIKFISDVVQHRDTSEEYILSEIASQDQAMWNNGIQAVGDISNAPHTSTSKFKSKIRYHTFIEMFDFLNPNFAESSYDKYFAAYEAMQLKNGDKISLVPHAPYTVSTKLFEKINAFNANSDVTISIHNQETPGENSLFINKTGDLINFYKSFDISLDHFEAINQRSIRYALAHMDPDKRTLLVHNTTCIAEDIKFANQWGNHITWVTCPNANLYIENRLPDYQLFIDQDQHIAIGTDSLTSNWQLSILGEIKTIKKYKSFIDDKSLLRWATINGAQALGFDDQLGSIEVGKAPGLLLLTGDHDQGIRFNSNSQVTRII